MVLPSVASEEIVEAVFHELRDRLTPREAVDAAAQMPTGLKELWLASESPQRTVRRIHKTDFIREVGEPRSRRLRRRMR